MAPPFRADHIGSLLRPPSLLEARRSLQSSTNLYAISQDQQVKDAEAKTISEVVQLQLQHEVRPITSGEYGRHIFYGGFFETLSGMTPVPDLPILESFRTDFPTTTALAKMGAKTRAAVICTGPIRWKESAYLEEWHQVTKDLPKELWKDVKITMPAPSYQHMQLKPGTAYTASSGYKDDEEYFSDLAKAYVSECQVLYDAGCRNIQIDDPHLTYFCSEQFLGGCRKDGVDTDALLDLYLRAHNLFLEKLPKDLNMGVHLCRGNMSGSTHWVTGSYDSIAQQLFTKTKYENYYLEFDDGERQGGFEPLRYLEKGKNVVLGLVSTKRAELESAEWICEQVREAAEVIAKAQGVSDEEVMGSLAVSPQCGFSSSSLAGGKDMTMERMWEKLELVRDVARKLWKDAR